MFKPCRRQAGRASRTANLSFQQDIGRFKIAVVVLVARGNKESDLRPLIPELLVALTSAVPGQIARIGE